MRTGDKLFAVGLGVAALVLVLAALAGAAVPTPTQLPGTAGCIAQGGRAGCAAGRAMSEPFEPLAISPDGKIVYLVAADPGRIDLNSLDVLDRDPTTGALTQKPGAEGCLSTSGKAGCVLDPRLAGISQVAVSPDGADVYVTSASGVVGFARDAATGTLTALPPPAECLGGAKVRAPCKPAAGIGTADGLAFSPDGSELYVTGLDRPTVAVLRRDPATGALSEIGCVTAFGKNRGCGGRLPEGGVTEVVASADGRDVYATVEAEPAERVVTLRRNATGTLRRASCFSFKGRGGCAVGRGFAGISGMALSPDGRSLYVASDEDGSGGTIAIFARGVTGTLSQSAGKAACLSATFKRECAVAPTARTIGGIAVSPDGTTVYAATVDGVAILSRAPSGLLAEVPAPAGCLSDFAHTCTQARNLEATTTVALSPDGANLYVVSAEPGGISTFGL